jgi:hypothetical protein
LSERSPFLLCGFSFAARLKFPVPSPISKAGIVADTEAANARRQKSP